MICAGAQTLPDSIGCNHLAVRAEVKQRCVDGLAATGEQGVRLCQHLLGSGVDPVGVGPLCVCEQSVNRRERGSRVERQ